MIDYPQARHIIETLRKEGFIAYYAGGWVRDLLLRHPSDDIDIATNAPPKVVQKLFEKTVPIGIAFGIVLVIIDDHEYEVATFRQDLGYQDGRRPTHIEFTTAEEDAKRRDFTINGMFYDPVKEEIFDFVGGKKDLEAKIIRAIGDPHERFREDRLRMVRAVRMACRFDFAIEIETEKAILAHADELFPSVAVERIWQEFLKAHRFGKLRLMLIKLHLLRLLPVIFPDLKGVSLEEVEKRLEPVKRYPEDAPAVAFLLPLFPEYKLDDALQMAKMLKLSNLDMQFIRFQYHALGVVQLSNPDFCEWAYLYSNEHAAVSLRIIAAHIGEHGALFLNEHEKQMATLHTSVERIRKKNPVVRSEHLQMAGITAGPLMGQLLQEAERISINQQLFTPEEVIAKLKKLPIWPLPFRT